MATSKPNVYQLKKQMCDIGYRIWHRGFCAGNEGNHSVRIGPDRFLCTPTGISKGFLEPDDICVVNGKGEMVEPNRKGRNRTSEVLVHLAIYEKMPHINAVIHSHPPHAVAFCIAGMDVPNSIHPEAEVFLGNIVSAEYATPGTPDLPMTFLNKIDDTTNTVLMANHGSVNFDKDLYQAYYNLEILDNYCKQLLLAKQLGNINMLDKGQMAEIIAVKEKFNIPDNRGECIDDGCVGNPDQAFLNSLGNYSASASCDSNGGRIQAKSSNGPSNIDPAAFEQMVQTITNQIIGSLD